MASPLWEPGKAVYSEWLKTLTPEEKQIHLLERKQRKTMKKAMAEVIESQKEAWLAKMNNALDAVLTRAVETGDATALATVYDRIIGKPDTNLDVTSNGTTLQAPTVIFQSTVADEWKDEDSKAA